MVVMFALERETKGALRYNEVEEAGKPPVIGTLYIKKYAVVGQPQRITVTVEV